MGGDLDLELSVPEMKTRKTRSVVLSNPIEQFDENAESDIEPCVIENMDSNKIHALDVSCLPLVPHDEHSQKCSQTFLEGFILELFVTAASSLHIVVDLLEVLFIIGTMFVNFV